MRLFIMSYWHHVQSAAGTGGNYHWVLLGCVLGGILLSALAPASAPRLRGAIILTLLSLPGLLLCGWMLGRGAGEALATYRWVHFVSLMLLAVGIINLASVFLFRVLLKAVRVQPAPILRDTLIGITYVVVALMLLSHQGVELSGIIATSAVITAVIGFSLQDTLGNIMGGVALQMERSVAVGDWVRIGDIEGVVREIRWRQTSIETNNWDTVVIPNSQLMKLQVTVLGRREGKPKLHAAWIYFNVEFRHAPMTVMDTVQAALRSEGIANVASNPPPECLLHEFGDGFGKYGAKFWVIDCARLSPTSSEVRTRIFLALHRAGITPDTPAQSVLLTMEGRARHRQMREEENARRVSAMKQVALFEPLTHEELSEVADRLAVAPFRAGEVIVRQGQPADDLYIVRDGEVSVRVERGNGPNRQVATLGPGEVFGEMGLMTGAPRAATVTALSDVVCYRLNKAGFADILQRRRAIAEAIADLMSRRKLELAAAHEEMSADAIRNRVTPDSEDLLQRIRKFFNLV
jgi:small-conductance mechanosensitive channel/CRP-like cAMP-binding protein